MRHEFHVGQFVELKPNLMRAAATGAYEIIRLMPEPEISSESPRYRIKSSAEIHQRIVPESDLMLATGPTARSSIDMLREVFLATPIMSLPTLEG
ncbi:hypothetical protein [Bradyrhizobium sp. SZCCHNR1070]|uniref:hypothetical protein n=1 Tax=Bradyrhizobium sp. SZCCHNR1070 TaxID=3057361 RepID=UPI002916A103|nr:hypothetical protein [Bradyrhizobium sp. SZCCHNR1070]